MVTNGQPDEAGVLTEVIDVQDSTMTCLTLDNFPRKSRNPCNGGIIDGKIVLCGGYDIDSSNCRVSKLQTRSL